MSPAAPMASEAQGHPTVFAGPADIARATGVTLGPTPWFDVTQKDVDAFAAVTRDWQKIHSDPEFTQASGFGPTIAHGYYTLSLLSMFASQLYRVEKVDHVINYGIDSLRFLAAVPVGARIRATATPISTRERGELTLVTVHYDVELEGEIRPCLVADSTIALVPTPEG